MTRNKKTSKSAPSTPAQTGVEDPSFNETENHFSSHSSSTETISGAAATQSCGDQESDIDRDDDLRLNPTGYGFRRSRVSKAISQLQTNNSKLQGFITLDATNWKVWNHQFAIKTNIAFVDVLILNKVLGFKDLLCIRGDGETPEETIQELRSLTHGEFYDLNSALANFIHSTIGEEAARHVRDPRYFRNGLAAYAELQNNYASSSMGSIKKTIKTMVSMNQGSKSMAEVVDDVRQHKLVLDRFMLDNPDFDYVEALAKIALLHSLRTEYTNLRDVISLTIDKDDGDPATFEAVAAYLVDRERESKMQTSTKASSSTAVANVATVAPITTPPVLLAEAAEKEKQQPKVKCTFCHITGHTVENCRKMKSASEAFLSQLKDRKKESDSKTVDQKPTSSEPSKTVGAPAWSAKSGVDIEYNKPNAGRRLLQVLHSPPNSSDRSESCLSSDEETATIDTENDNSWITVVRKNSVQKKSERRKSQPPRKVVPQMSATVQPSVEPASVPQVSPAVCDPNVSYCWAVTGMRAKPKPTSDAELLAVYFPLIDPAGRKFKDVNLDSGSSLHYWNSSEGLTDVRTDDPVNIEVACGTTYTSVGYGSIPGKIGRVEIVPEFQTNLFSIGKLNDEGYSMNFKSGQPVIPIERDGVTVALAYRIGNLYRVRIYTPLADAPTVTETAYSSLSVHTKDKIWTLHKSLGHPSAAALYRLLKLEKIAGPISITLADIQAVQGRCVFCPHSKSVSASHSDLGGKVSSTDPFELVHFDIKGPLPITCYAGGKYIFVLVDDFSRGKFVYILRQRSNALDALKIFQSSVVTPDKFIIRKLRCDNAGEFKSDDIVAWAQELGIGLTYSPAYSSQSNGIAERAIRTLQTIADSLRAAGNFPASAWSECWKTAAVLDRYLIPAGKSDSPFSLIYKRDPPYHKLQPIGCKAFINIDLKLRTPLGPKAIEGCHIGYSEDSPCYRIWTGFHPNPVTESGNVSFTPNCPHVEPDHDGLLPTDLPSAADRLEDYQNVGSGEEGGAPLPLPLAEESVISPKQPIRAEKRVTRSHSKLSNENEVTWGKVSKENILPDDATKQIMIDQDFNEAELQALINPPDPGSYPTVRYQDHIAIPPNSTAFSVKDITDKEAINDPLFLQAMQKEIDEITAKGGWSLEYLPEGRTAIGSLWIHKRKLINGILERMKSRLCPLGNHQAEGVDYLKSEVSSPTISLPSTRLFFAIVVCRDMFERQLDVNSAFTIPELKEDIYMKIPKGLQQRPGMALKLHHSLNGLKQGGYNWFKLLNEFLISVKYVPCVTEPCMYRQWVGKSLTLIALYTDDLRVAADREEDLNTFEHLLANKFPIKTADKSQFLGMQIIREPNTIRLSLEIYIDKMLETHKLTGIKEAKTPTISEYRLISAIDPPNKEFMKTFPYHSLVGALLWIARCSRDDILFAVSQVGRFSHNFNQTHVDAVLRIISYLKHTKSLTLDFRKVDKMELVSYSDADFAGVPSDGDKPMKSTTGTAVMVKGCGTVYSQAVLQSIVALSSSESEYIALSNTVQRTMCIKNLLLELDLIPDEASVVYEDNEVTLRKAESFTCDYKVRHIALHYHFFKEHIRHKQCRLEYVRSADNVADIFTKGLPLSTFVTLRTLLLNHHV